MIHPSSSSPMPSFYMRRLTRIIAALVIISLTVAAILSLFVVDLWRQDRNSALWHIAFDVAFGLSLVALIVWLAQRTILQMETIEKALRQNEERLHRITDNTFDLICETDAQGLFRYVSPSYRTVLGYDPAQLIGHSAKEFTHPDDVTRARLEDQQTLNQGRAGNRLELRLRHADGHYLWIEASSQLVFDERQQITGTVVINRDITSRKQTEETLARTRAHLEHRNQQLTQILEAGNLLRMNLGLDAVLHEIVRGAHQALGYGIVVLNLLDETSQQMVVHSYAGLDEAGQQTLRGGVYTWEDQRRLLRAEFRLGRAYFIPHGALDWRQELSGPIYVPDLPISAEPDAWHPDNMLFTPIELRDGHIAGTIWLDAPQDGKRPTIESLRPLEIFVNQAAIAIENARLFEAERQHRRELEAVYSASRQLTQSLELTEVLDAILSSVTQLVPATSAQLFLYDGEKLTFGSGLSEDGQKMAWPPSEPRPQGLTYTVARTGEALFIEDTASHPVFNAGSLFQPPMLAVAGLPLKIEAAILGVMNVSYAAPHRFAESERYILGLLAAQAAIALHNARLHQQVQSYAVELEQRVAERTVELEHQRQHLQAILDSAGEGIQLMSPDGHIEYVNPATERIAGYAASEMLGQPTRLWSDNINSVGKLSSLREQVQRGQPWQGEIVNRRRDGTLYDAAITITPLKDQQEQITGFVVVHRDITSLKELDHLKDQFVSRIGHELRTPIANIKLYAQLLERGKPDKQHDYLQTIQHEIDRLTYLNDSFLEMAELDAGRTPLRLSPVNLNQLLKDLLRDLDQKVQPRSLALELQAEPRWAGSTITTDRALIARAISALLDNALAYAPHDTTISVTTGSSESAGEHWHTISVHNAGMGISAAELPRLFERFYRGEAARDYKAPGAGLGLSIAQTIMHKLGGRLTADSQPGQGVTFTVWLK